MPTTWRIVVSDIDYEQVRCQHLHAALCGMLDGPEDHRAERKDWSVGPPQGDGRHLFLTVRTLTDDRAETFLQRAVIGRQIIMGAQEGVITRLPELTAQASWEDLAYPTRARQWRLEFLSPTSMGAGTRYSPFVDPPSLVRSLLARWEAASDAWLPRLTPEELTRLWVSDIRGRTVLERIPQKGPQRTIKVVPGFVGAMTLRATEPMVAGAMDCLLRFAEFAGVGACVAHGLGSVKVTAEASSPRTMRRPAQAATR